MDGERKKRKMEDEEDDDEDQKMELFFALVRSTREVHEMLKKGEHKCIQKANEDKQQQPPPAVWNPCFQPEDFMEDVVQVKAAGGGSGCGTSNPAIPRTSFSERDKDAKYLMEEVELPSAGTCKREVKESGDIGNGGDKGLDLNLSL